jgi:hypothetical protein
MHARNVLALSGVVIGGTIGFASEEANSAWSPRTFGTGPTLARPVCVLVGFAAPLTLIPAVSRDR